MIKLYDESKTGITTLVDIYDYYIEEGINTLPTVHFKYPLSSDYANSIAEEGYITVPYISDNSANWFTIKEVKKDFNEIDVLAVMEKNTFNSTHFYKLNFGTTYNTVTKSYKDKKGHTKTKKIKVKVDVKKTLTDALDLIIDKSTLDTNGWSYVDSRSARKKAKKKVFKVTKCTPWTAFLKTVSIWKYEYKLDNKNKIIYIYDKIGADKGAYFIEELNLTNLEVDKNSQGICTRIYPYGKTGAKKIGDDKVSCTVVINGAINAATGSRVKKADAAKDSNGNTVTTQYIENRNYINKRIILHKTWSDDDEPQDLYDDALEYLEEHCKPTIAYTASVTDLSKYSGYEMLSYSIGDTVHLTSKTTGVRGTFRIVAMVRYPYEPDKNTCTLANKKSNLIHYLLSNESANSVIQEITGSDTSTNGTIIEEGTVNTLGIGEGEVGSANVDMLTANEIDCDTLVADTGFIENLTTDNAFITSLTANKAFVDDLTANNAFVNYLDTKTIKADNITTGTLGAGVIFGGKINADSVASGTLDASLVNITNLTADKIAAGTLGADVVFGGTINGDKITSGTIDASKVHMVNLDASNITAGVLTADKLVLRGTDKSIIYQLNNIAGATQVISTEKLNGEVINDKTITAKQIDVGNLTADTGFVNNLSANTALIGQIQANVLDVNKLNALGIKAGKVDAENITGTTITGKTISGGSVTGAAINNGNGTFTVDANGCMTASNANITGTINAYSGNIGSFTIQNNSHDGYIGYGLQCHSFYNGEYHDVLINDNQLYVRNITSGKQSVMTYDYVMSPQISSTDKFISAGTATFLGTTIDNWGDINFKSSATVIRNKAGNQALNPLSSSGNVALSTNKSGNGDTNIYAGGKIMLQTTCKTSSGATVTSDRNMKENILPVDDKYIKLFDELKPVTFEYKNGASGRTHLGYIAQDVKAAMDDVGLSDKEFAGWCKDKNNNELKENRATNDDGTYPEYTYALRYGELGMLATVKIKQLDKTIKQLEAEIQELKANK